MSLKNINNREEIIKQDKCVNNLLCNQFVNKTVSNSFCKDCLFYFNYRMIFKNNKKENLICPICLYSPDLFIKQKNCNHHICSNCIYDVYFDKSFIRNMPHNPVKFLKKSWDLFIYSNQAAIFKKHMIDNYANYTFNENRYKNAIERYNFLIPSIFKKNIKMLIQFQLIKNSYIYEYKITQYDKIKMLKICPYCRSSNNFTKTRIERITSQNTLLNNNQTVL